MLPNNAVINSREAVYDSNSPFRNLNQIASASALKRAVSLLALLGT